MTYFPPFTFSADEDLSKPELIKARVAAVTKHNIDTTKAAQDEMVRLFPESGSRPKDSKLWAEIKDALDEHRALAYKIGDVLQEL